MKNGIVARALFALAVSCVLVSPAYAEEHINATEREPNIFEKVFYFIDTFYLYPVDLKRCADDILKALSGNSLPYDSAQARDTDKNEFVCLDRFSGFMTSEETKAMDIWQRGSFAGIGIHIGETIKSDSTKTGVLVRHIFKGGPAASSGIQVGDMLLRVREGAGDTFVDIQDVKHAVQLLTGTPGSEVVVVVLRNGMEIALPSIIRAVVKLPSVYSFVVPSGIGYVQIRTWGEQTADELEAALAKFEKEASPRVIIDVRNNSGGLMWSVLEALFYFNKQQNSIVLSERFKNGEKVFTIDHLATKCEDPETNALMPCFVSTETDEFKTPGRFARYRITVLVNDASASASEIFAGTMKDWGSRYKNFIVLGDKTFGKGVVQKVIPLTQADDGPMFRLTVSEYFVGNAKVPVHGIGVLPNFVVEDSREVFRDTETKLPDTATHNDLQFQAALRMWGALDDPLVKEFLSRKHFDEFGDIIE